MKKLIIILLFALTATCAFAQYSAVRVNALTLITGAINAGFDVAVSKKWSVDVSGGWNPITPKNLSMKVLYGTVGVRHWKFEPHVGFYWGIHWAAAKYKIGNRHTRFHGWTTGLGSSVGYNWMLSRRWNLSLEGGLGLFYMADTKWYPNSSPYEDICLEHYTRIVLAPSKFELSFSYLF